MPVGLRFRAAFTRNPWRVNRRAAGDCADRQTEAQQKGGSVAEREKRWYDAAMEELFGHPAYKGFVLQDAKRLPGRFFARISGALLCLLP